jgi:hypothetical protein
MSILNKLLHKCNYQLGGKIKKYDTGGAFAHAGMDNDEKAAYMKSNRDLSMQRAAMSKKHGTLLVMDKDKGVVANIYTGSYTPKKYTFNSGIPERTTITGSLKMPENHTIDNTPLTKELLLSKAEEALLKSGRTDVSAKDLADLAEAQKRAEGYYPGSTAYETNNPFNVGNTGNKKNYLPDLNTGLSTYYDLILKRYLVNGKKPEDLVEDFVNVDGNRYAKDPNYEKNVSAFLKEIKAKKNQTGGTIKKDNAQALLDRLVLENNNKNEKDRLSYDDLYNYWQFAISQIGTESGNSSKPNTSPSEFVFNTKNGSSNIINNNPVNIRDITKPIDSKTGLYPFKKYDDKSNTTGINEYLNLISGYKYLDGDLSKKNVDRLVNSGYERKDLPGVYYDSNPKVYKKTTKEVRKTIDRNLTFPEVPVFGKKPMWLADKEKYVQSHPISKEVNNYYKDNNLTYPVMGENIPPVVQNKYDADTSKHVLKSTLRRNPRQVRETTNAYKDRIVNRTYDGVTAPITYLDEAVKANPNMIKDKRTFRDALGSIFHQAGGVYLPPIKKKKEDLSNSVKKGEIFSVESKPATMVNPELNPTMLAPVEITARKYGWNRDIEKYRNEQRQRSPISQLFHHKSDEKIKRQYVPRLLDNLDTDTNDLALDKTESDFINKYGDKAQKRFYKTINTDDYRTQKEKTDEFKENTAYETMTDQIPGMSKLKVAGDFIQGNWIEAIADAAKVPNMSATKSDFIINALTDNPSGYSAKDIQDKYFYQPKLYMDNPAIPLKIGFQRLLDPSLPKLSEVNNPELQEFIIYYMQRGHDYKSALNAYNNVTQKRNKAITQNPKTTYKDGKLVYDEKKPDKLVNFVRGLGTQRQTYK